MKKQIKTNRRTTLFTHIVAVVFIFAANSLTFAQTDYKVGDKIEAKDGGKWYKARIIEAKDGKFKIHYDSYDAVMDVWATPEYIRRIGGDTPTTNEKKTGNQTQEPTSVANKAAKYKPGDRVECDKASIGVWEKGTVMPFAPDDTNKNSGNFYRVRLDSFVKGGLYLAGHECRTENIRPLGETSLKASGKYKVGDRIEAQNSYLSWLPAKIIAANGAFYTVRYDSRDERYDETIDDLRIRKIGGKQAENADKSKNPETVSPKPNAAAQLMPGTAWSLRLYNKSKGYSADGTIMTMLFCTNGRYDMVRRGLSAAPNGTYKMAGKNLTLKNGQGGQTETYTISSPAAGTFELSDGSDIIWRLFDGVRTDCK